VKADSTKTSPSDSTNLAQNSQLAGKVAVVTGASSGIGEATARELTRLSASVVMAARRFDRFKAIAGEIEASGGRAYPLATDTTQAYDLKRMVEAAQKQYGRLDYAVNNAGASSQGAFMDMAVEDFDHCGSQSSWRGPRHAGGDSGDAEERRRCNRQCIQRGRACGYSRDVFIRSNQMRSDRSHQERSA
jgi:NADPH:quinone reductase-like Zn-dependent oxidoreductase